MTPADDLLGGAERGRTRQRGFAPWTPQAKTRALLEQVHGVLVEYRDYLPLTCRQIYYRLVGAHGYPKTELAYARLCDVINRARRARLVSMDDIRDSWSDSSKPEAWGDAEEFLAAVRDQGSRLRLDRTAGQDVRLVVLCEAAGMVPQIATAVEDYGIAVYSSGGFDSTTIRHQFAFDLAGEDRPTEVLHLGDHDPSGVHMFLALKEDVQAFAAGYGADVSFVRLAVTAEQIIELHLPTAPPKPTDNRAFTGQTCQCEAIPPDVLNRIVRDAVAARTDHDLRARVLDEELVVRHQLHVRLKPPPVGGQGNLFSDFS